MNVADKFRFLEEFVCGDIELVGVINECEHLCGGLDVMDVRIILFNIPRRVKKISELTSLTSCRMC